MSAYLVQTINGFFVVLIIQQNGVKLQIFTLLKIGITITLEL